MKLIADIGGTHTRCAVIDKSGQIRAPEVFQNNDFDSLQGLLHNYRKQQVCRLETVALAVAAPVLGDEVRMPNINWKFSQVALKAELEIRNMVVVNDFAAVAWALPELDTNGLHKIGGGAPVARAAMTALGPGSGLGVATAAPCANDWTVLEGEGGNITFTGATPEQQAVAEQIGAERGHCSAENLLSGPGLANIYVALAAQQSRGVARPSPAQVSAAASTGEPLASAACAMFFEILGATAGNLALTVGARGGVYVAGGIIPKLLKAFEQSRFREYFESKGRYRYYLEAIPTYVITEPYPAFLGLRRLLGHS